MTERELAAIVKGIVPAIREQIAGDLAALREAQDTKITTLEATVQRLEGELGLLQTKAMKYAGVWEPAKCYEVGEIVTRSGSLWTCLEKNSAHSFPFSCFKLIEKGRDGKDTQTRRPA